MKLGHTKDGLTEAQNGMLVVDWRYNRLFLGELVQAGFIHSNEG